MQITLHQSDIEKSLKDYIAAQGIRINGKHVEIAFTAGRRGTGVTAEISIEDSVLAPTNHPDKPEILVAINLSPLPAFPEVKEVGEVSANDPEPVPAKTTSLFG